MKKRFLGFVLLCCVVMLSSCSANTSTVKRPVASAFDTVVEGQKLSLYMLKNKNGMEVYLTNYGARIVAIYTPDRNGKFANVVLGYDSISQYLKDQKYTGCVVGRYANRISNGRLVLDSTYQLTQNEKTNLLHGGDVYKRQDLNHAARHQGVHVQQCRHGGVRLSGHQWHKG